MREAERAEVIIDEEMARVRALARVDGGRPDGRRDPREGRADPRRASSRRRCKRLGGLSEKELETVEALTAAIVNKMLHGPTARLKQVAGEKDGYDYVEAARYLYGLDSNPEGKSPHGSA